MSKKNKFRQLQQQQQQGGQNNPASQPSPSHGPSFEKESGWGGQLSANWKTRVLPILIVIIVVVGFFLVKGSGDNDLEVIDLTENGTGNISKNGAILSEGSFAVEVLPGDNQTLVTRRAITQWLSEQSEVDASDRGRRLYAETILVKEMENETLPVDQAIFSSSKIERTLLSYDDLTQYQKNTWTSMARNVPFQ